jgi:hypothetical protein
MSNANTGKPKTLTTKGEAKCCQNRAITCHRFAIIVLVMHVQTGSHREVMISDYDSDDDDDNMDLVCVQNCSSEARHRMYCAVRYTLLLALPPHTHRKAK